jgi:hypothetical protein
MVKVLFSCERVIYLCFFRAPTNIRNPSFSENKKESEFNSISLLNLNDQKVALHKTRTLNKSLMIAKIKHGL